MAGLGRFAAHLWGWKRYWLVPLLLFTLLLIGLAVTGDPEPRRSFTYATF
jgi:hypothetical protein